MLLKIVANTITLILVLYSAFNYHKYKKEIPELKKHYTYYFIIMCIYLSIDAELSFITSFIPFYQVMKLLTVVWLSLPVFAAPSFVYKFYLGSIFGIYGDKIDCCLSKIRNRLREFLGNTYEKTYKKLKTNKIKHMKENEENLSLREIESQIIPGDLPDDSE
ncbi:hypothetical protein H311_03896 [Anncaliia algerae PRA109]|nr:hypothetical protein H311_03896 [Anncaliia algerae PRA109]